MPAEPLIPASSLEFLKSLKINNNRDWFNARKDEFTEQKLIIETFAEGLLQALNIHDVIETASGKKSLQRIYKDTRFSKEKIPYKSHWGGHFSRATKLRRGGYYYHIEPGNSFVAGGFQNPNSDDLKLIRKEISLDVSALREILNSKSFTETFGVLRGEKLKTTPKGFDATDEAIDLLRYKQFLLVKTFTDKEVIDRNFVQSANQAFQNMRPFLNYMTAALTLDNNGLEI